MLQRPVRVWVADPVMSSRPRSEPRLYRGTESSVTDKYRRLKSNHTDAFLAAVFLFSRVNEEMGLVLVKLTTAALEF